MNRHKTISIFLHLLLQFAVPSHSMAQSIEILKSYNLPPYEQVASSFVKNYKNNVVVTSMQGDAKKGELLAKEIKKRKPALVVAIGTKAAFALSAEFTDTAVLCLLVSRPETNLAVKDNIYGIRINPSPASQFKLIKELFPRVKRVGVIREKSNVNSLSIEGVKVSGDYGIELVESQIDDASKLPEALRNIHKNTDALWLIMDNLVVSKESIEHIMKESIFRKYPVIGFSPATVKKGALASVVTNYEDLGKAATGFARNILKGKVGPNRRFRFLDSDDYIFNKRIIELLEITLPEKIVNKTVNVYE